MNLFRMDDNHVGLYKVLIFNFISMLFSFTNIENFLKLTLLIISIAYTVFKFHQDYKKSKNENDN
jgi:hypothetical protein